MALATYNGDFNWDDTFVVVSVLSKPDAKKFAVTYLWNHPDSSSHAYGVWLQDWAPQAGSSARPPSEKNVAIVYAAEEDVRPLTWQNRGLVITVPKTLSVNTRDRLDCLYLDTRKNGVCIDPQQVEVARE